MKRIYRVTYYGPDGDCGGFLWRPPALHNQTFATLTAARDAVRSALGGRTFGKWDGLPENDDIEAWHESHDECCGGYAIQEVK